MVVLLVCGKVIICDTVPFASRLRSSNITHSSAVLSWESPGNITLISEYGLTINQREERIINDPSQTVYELQNLEIWTNYTVVLVTYDFSHNAIGSDRHSFSTHFFFANVQTLLAFGFFVYIVVCYILALILKFTCNLETDESEWRRIMIAEYEKTRRARQARAKRVKSRQNRSLKRQVSSLLGWKRKEDSTDYEDAISINSIQSIQSNRSTNNQSNGVVKEDEAEGQDAVHVEITGSDTTLKSNDTTQDENSTSEIRSESGLDDVTAVAGKEEEEEIQAASENSRDEDDRDENKKASIDEADINIDGEQITTGEEGPEQSEHQN